MPILCCLFFKKAQIISLFQWEEPTMNEENQNRLSKKELHLLSRKLDLREMEILKYLHKVKFASSNQLRRVFF